jgi:hypothetical protein
MQDNVVLLAEYIGDMVEDCLFHPDKAEGQKEGEPKVVIDLHFSANLRELTVKLGLLEYNLEEGNISMKEAFAGLYYSHAGYVQGLVDSHVKRLTREALGTRPKKEEPNDFVFQYDFANNTKEEEQKKKEETL